MRLKKNEYPPKQILEKLVKDNLTPTEICKKLDISIYKTKIALMEYGLFIGKTYDFICEGCKKKFSHFTKDYKFCSDKCKHKHQMIWNRNKTKYNDIRIKSLAEKAIGNTRGFRSEKFKYIIL